MTLDLPDAHVELFNREPHFAIVEKPCSLSTSIHPSIHVRSSVHPSVQLPIMRLSARHSVQRSRKRNESKQQTLISWNF